jgi:hypothetical protein
MRDIASWSLEPDGMSQIGQSQKVWQRSQSRQLFRHGRTLGVGVLVMGSLVTQWTLRTVARDADSVRTISIGRPPPQDASQS